MVFKYYKVTNINGKDLLYYLKEYAQLNGWIIDKYVNNDPIWELYLHAPDPIDNLYYSFQLVRVNQRSGDENIGYILKCYANTGFNNSLNVDNQPGKFYANTDIEVYNYPSGNLIGQNLTNVYYFITNKFILFSIFCYLKHANIVIGSCNLPQLFGQIQKFTPSKQYGNYISLSYIRSFDFYGIWMMLTFGCICYVHDLTTRAYTGSDPIYAALLFENNINTINNSKLYISTGIANYRWPHNNGLIYPSMISLFTFTNRAILYKPILSVSHSIGGYNYHFPVGELPIYICRFYPYFTIDQTITYGNRKFKVYPFGVLNATYGFAIEYEDG